jgi:hypothetical protein
MTTTAWERKSAVTRVGSLYEVMSAVRGSLFANGPLLAFADVICPSGL